MDKNKNPSNKSQVAKSISAPANGINFTIQKKDIVNQNLNQTHQLKENKTGLPDNLKSGIEHLSGIDISDVKVHYNSPQPAQLNAHAYAQGNQIHVAPGQEKHLPHEAWHVVQQKQGRVKPTKQLKGKVNINDDAGLEKEADVMGNKALQAGTVQTVKRKSVQQNNVTSYLPVQAVFDHLSAATKRQFENLALDFVRIQNRTPHAWQNRLDVLADLPLLAADCVTFRINRNNAQDLWDTWQVAYNRARNGEAFAFPGILATAANQMDTYFQNINGVYRMLEDVGFIANKKAIVQNHYLNVNMIPGMDNAFYEAHLDENLNAFKGRIRNEVMNYVRPGAVAWTNAAQYNFDPHVDDLGLLAGISHHWTLFQANLGDLANLRVEDGAGNVNVNAINDALVPTGAGNVGVHVSLEVAGVGDHKPRIFGRPANLARVYNNANRPPAVAWANMQGSLDAHNLVIVNRIQAWAGNRNNNIKPNWEAH